MENISIKGQVQELLKDHPGLQIFGNRMISIAELASDADQETDLAKMADSFKTVLRLQDNLHAEVLIWNSQEHEKQFKELLETCNEWKRIANKQEAALIQLDAALKQERQDNRETFDNLCEAFLINPRKAFETVMRFIERDEKCKCADGRENLSWTLAFSLPARIRMAWRLLFGVGEDANA